MEISPERLQEMRFLGDPDADATIARIVAKGEVEDVNIIFRDLATNEDIPDNSHPEIHDFFTRNAHLPADVDWERIRKGQDVFCKNGPTILLSLFTKSLPECYACANGAEVLFRTGRLTVKGDNFKRYARRLMETAQFVVDVLWEGAFTSEGKAFVALHKIRLIHASIRFYLNKKGWETEDLGVPINQEDQAGTLLAFSASVLEGIQLLNVDLTEEEIDGYMYLWGVLGRLMGVHEDLIPASYAEGLATMNAILDHQCRPSEAGEILTKSCHDFMDYVIPGNLFDGYPTVLTNHLCQERVNMAVAVQEKHHLRNRLMLRMTKVFNAVADDAEDNFGFVRGVTHRFGRKFLEGIFEYYNDWKEIQFQIPPSLKGDWQDHDVVSAEF